MEPAIAFAEARLHFGRYYRWQVRTQPKFSGDLAHEVGERLEQLGWILDNVRKIESEMPPVLDAQWHRDFKELWFFTESFYYFGWRTREVLRSLPLLASFDALGLRNVRNHLLEHPEKQSKIFQRSFSAGGPRGPTIKGPRQSDQVNVFPDAGIYANASEFVDNLLELLHRIVPIDEK
jgi:hypothetical protein